MEKAKKLPPKVEEILNSLLMEEYKAYWHYTSLWAQAKNMGFELAAKFFKEEANAEMGHADMIKDYIVDWNGTPAIPPTNTKTTAKGLPEMVSSSYNIEYALYEKYEEDSSKILDIGDLCVFDFLGNFRKIQKDSVTEYSDMLNILEGVEPTKINMLLIEENLFGE